MTDRTKTLYLVNSVTKILIGSVDYNPANIAEDIAPLILACDRPTTFTISHGDTVHTGVQVCSKDPVQ